MQTISKATFSSLPWSSGRSAFTLGLTQKSIKKLGGGAAASVILGSPGQFMVALEHFHQAGVLMVPDCQVQALPTGHHYVLYTPLPRKVYLV